MLAQMRGTISPAAMTLPPGRQFKVMSGPTATDAAPSKGAEADHEAVLGRAWGQVREDHRTCSLRSCNGPKKKGGPAATQGSASELV